MEAEFQWTVNMTPSAGSEFIQKSLCFQMGRHTNAAESRTSSRGKEDFSAVKDPPSGVLLQCSIFTLDSVKKSHLSLCEHQRALYPLFQPYL